MTTAADRVLIDTNVLVYASLRQSAFHAQAVRAIHMQIQTDAELWVSRQVLREYIAVLTRPSTTTLASPATTSASDVAAFQRMFRVADDTAAVTANLLRLIQAMPIGGKLVHDANLVATMQANGISRILTHNTRDFVRFGALITVVPITT